MKRTGLILLLLSIAKSAGATYTIGAVNKKTLQVGAAGASCAARVFKLDVASTYAAVPGVGLVLAQASAPFDLTLRQKARDLIEAHNSPRKIFRELITLDDGNGGLNSTWEQYGIATLYGPPRSFTGNTVLQNKVIFGNYAGVPSGHRAATTPGITQGEVGNGANLRDGNNLFRYAIQANRMTSVAVLDQAEAAFRGASGAELADRLMAAVEAGAANQQGDNLCSADGIPADTAFLRVDFPDGSVFEVSAAAGDPVHDTCPDRKGPTCKSAVAELRKAYDAKRSQLLRLEQVNAIAVPVSDEEISAEDAADDANIAEPFQASESSGCSMTGTRSGQGLGMLLALGLVVTVTRRRRTSHSLTNE